MSEVSMGRKSAAIKNIMNMYTITEKESDEIIKRTKTVLKIVRSVYWATKNKAENLKSDATGMLSHNLDSCLFYLSDFAPIKEQQDFEANVFDLFQNKWMIQLLEKALQNVKSYPELGELYHSILYKSYFDATNLQQDKIAVELHMDASYYYARKKEAVLLFAFSFAGIITTELKPRKARNQRNNKKNHNQ